MKKTLMFKEDLLKFLSGYVGSIDDIKNYINNYQLVPDDSAPDYFKQLIKEDRDHWLEALDKMEFSKEKIAEILADQDNDVRAVVDVNLQISLRYDQVFELLPKSSELTILLGILAEDEGTLYQSDTQKAERIVKINALKRILMKLEKDDETRVTNTEYSDFDKETDDVIPEKKEQ